MAEAGNGIYVARHIDTNFKVNIEHQVKQAILVGTDIVVEQAGTNGRSIAIYPLSNKSCSKPKSTYSIEVSSYIMLYVKSLRVFVASCEDLQLRVYCPLSFEVTQIIPTQSSLLCLQLEGNNELIGGGIGQIYTWSISENPKHLLESSTGFKTTIKPEQWVVALSISQDQKTLLAVTHEGVHVISLNLRSEINFLLNGHKSSITSAVCHSQMNWIITGGRDGIIKMWSQPSGELIYTIPAHSHSIISLVLHSSKPLLFSASGPDGLIKVWELTTVTKVTQFHTEEGLGDFRMIDDFHGLTCSQHRFTVLNINIPDEHFAHLTSAISSLSFSGAQGRFLVLCEDGGFRLFCPLSGKEICVVFPEFNMQQIFMEAIYVREHDSVIARLKTNEVMVYDASLNPCCCKVLCTPNEDKDGITCIAQGTVSFDEDILELVFAGHKSGFITLFSGTSITMDDSTRAHKGAVISISMSPVDPHLLSLGTDSYANIWLLKIYYGQLSLIQLKSVDLDNVNLISAVALTWNTLCIAFKSSIIKMYSLNFRPKKKEGQSVKLSSLTAHEHSPTEDHTAAILSLLAFPDCPFFYSHAADNKIKLWGLDSLLLKEVFLGSGLKGAYILPVSHDIVVALNDNLWKIPPEEWIGDLEKHVVGNVAKAYPELQTKKERSILFDSNRDFWFDPHKGRKCGTLEPIEYQVLRAKSGNSSRGSLRNNDRSGLIKKIYSISSTKSDSLITDDENPTEKNKTIKVKRPLHHIKSPNNFECDYTETAPCNNTEETCEKTGSSHSLVSRCCSFDVVGILDDLASARNYPPIIVDRRILLPKPKMPSHQFPIAPDGYIANSIIRKRMGIHQRGVEKLKSSEGLTFDVRAFIVDRPSAYRSPSLDTYTFSDYSISGDNDNLETERDLENGDKISKMRDVIFGYEDDETKKPSKKSRNPSKGDPIDFLSRPKFKVDLEAIDLDYGPVHSNKKKTQKKRLKSPNFDYSGRCDSDSMPSRTPTPASKDHRGSLSYSHSHSSTSRPNTRLSQLSVPPFNGSKSSTQYSAGCSKHRLSTESFQRSMKDLEKVASVNLQKTAYEISEDRTMKLLQQITAHDWYPLSLRGTEQTPQKVLTTLVTILQSTSRSAVLKEVCQAVERMHNLGVLTQSSYEKLTEVCARQLQRRKGHSLVSLLDMIGNLQLRGRKLLKNLMRLLINDVDAVKEKAFETLEEVTGINTKSGLQKLLIEMQIIETPVWDDVDSFLLIAERLKANIEHAHNTKSHHLKPKELMSAAPVAQDGSCNPVTIVDIRNTTTRLSSRYDSEISERRTVSCANPQDSCEEGVASTLSYPESWRLVPHENTLRKNLIKYHKQTMMGNKSMKIFTTPAVSTDTFQKMLHLKETESNHQENGYTSDSKSLKYIPLTLQQNFTRNPHQLTSEVLHFMTNCGKRTKEGPIKKSAKNNLESFRWSKVLPVILEGRHTIDGNT